MVLGVGVHGEQLVADAERRFAPRLDLVRFGEREANLPEPGERAWRHLGSESNFIILLRLGTLIMRFAHFQRPTAREYDEIRL
jgi:hypothetical protein